MPTAIAQSGNASAPRQRLGRCDSARTLVIASTPTTCRASITVTGSSAGRRVMHRPRRKRRRLAWHDSDATYDHPPLCRAEGGAAVYQDLADGAPAGGDHRRIDAA